MVSVRPNPGISIESPKGPETASRSSSPGVTLTIFGFAFEIRRAAVTSRPWVAGAGCFGFRGCGGRPIVVGVPVRSGGWMKAAARVESPRRTSITITSLRAAIRRDRERKRPRSQIA